MEGIFYYWFMWLAWIMTTFLMDKSKTRIKLTAFILLTILMSKWYMVVSAFYINSSLIMFLLAGYYLAVKNKKRKLIIFYMTNLTLTFAYAGIMLFRIYDPVWFIFDYRIIVSISISVLAIYLGKSPVQRFSIYLISVCQGEFIYWIIMSKFHSKLTIGPPAFLDMMAIGCAMIYLWMILQQFTVFIEQSLQKLQKPTKEKQG